jgi:large subunit ribosomal protein L37e
MARGTPSFGKRHTKTHTFCRRCGRISYHKQHRTCAACGFGHSTRLRKYGWSKKVQQRKGTGTGRMKHIRYVNKLHQNGRLN